MMDGQEKGDTAQLEIDSTEPLGRHWMSYSVYSGPADILNGQTCIISVTLDAGAHTSFSGVRTLIVGKVTEELDKVRVKDWLESPYVNNHYYTMRSRSFKGRLEPKRPSYRETLAHHRNVNEQSEKLLASGSKTQLPICTVTLELSDTSNENWSSVGLTLRYKGLSTHKPLRVIYDRAVPFTPEQRSMISVLRLNSNHSFVGIPKPTMTGMLLRVSSGTPNHSIRVLSLSTRRSCPTLPLEVIRRITHHALQQRGRGFRSSLLSFALVCKAWSPVIDIFWEYLGTLDVSERPDPSSVSRALWKKPEKAKLVKSFRPWDYRAAGENKQPYYFSDAHLDVLSMVTSVKALSVSSIHPPLVELFLKVISTLSCIEKCTINNPITFRNESSRDLDADKSSDSPQGYHLDISDILKILPHWNNLRTLFISQNKDAKLRRTNEELKSDTYPSHNCKIQELYLQDGEITGSQLLHFISPSESSLSRVDFHGLHGLLNHDLISFFSQVSSTIKWIVVSRCSILRDTEDEEYAFDVVMSKMVSLHYVFIEGPNLASPLSVMRKPKSTRRGTNALPNMISVELAGPCQVNIDNILEVLQVTTWQTIRLVHPSFSGWGAELRDRVHEAARQRKISLELFHPDPMLL
ncbi:hypothetical protein BDZ94DRAFT_1324630 [Collybia nuda]|uniref:Uncharacterized protein n=1 Tax=Collybia nuda TaxID=64659 RepID=A0A9P5XXY4_9AGAR|nr:hypothetical protein BDZ94DRAFT_1324630 [Collybia nuda]